MRQKLISWLIEDIAPAVERSHDPEGEILKFASQHNLATALVETLGQLFNTAKTVAHFEKAANRGSDFPLLDVPAMVSKYLEVAPVKQASRHAESAFDQFNCGLDDKNYHLPDFFKDCGMPVQVVKDDFTETPMESKSASEPGPTRLTYRDETHERKNLEQLEQARFEFIEDLREDLTKLAQLIKRNGVDFEQFETDALAIHGDSVKAAVDATARFCNTKYTQVKRASADKKGEPRVVRDELGVLAQLEQVKFDMQKIAVATEALGEQTGLVERAAKPNKPREKVPDESPMQMTNEPDAPGKAQAAPSRKAPTSGGGERPSYVGALEKGFTNAAAPITNMPAMRGHLEDFLGQGFNSDQQQVDTGYADAKHMSVLQQLLMNDEVLSEADHDKVVSMFNTLRRTSPSIASDPNIAGVALRSMIQHDGISPFDVKSFLDTEGAKQKVDFNKQVIDDTRYGGKPVSKPSKVS